MLSRPQAQLAALAQAAPPGVGGHGLFAGRLDRQQLQRARAGGHQHGVAPVEQAAGRQVALPGPRAGGDDLELLAAPGAERARPGVVGAGHALDLLGRRAPVDQAVAAGQQAGVGGLGLVLGGGLERPGGVGLQHLQQQRRALVEELLGQRARAAVGRQGRAALGQDGAGVHLAGQAHHRHAGLGVAGQDGAGERGRAAVARQQRGVDVQVAERRDLERGPAQDLAVGRHHPDVRPQRGQPGDLGRVAQGLRLDHRQAQALHGLLDRRRLDRPAAPGRAVGLRHHPHHLVARVVEQRPQRDDGEVGGAEVDHTHRYTFPWDGAAPRPAVILHLLKAPRIIARSCVLTCSLGPAPAGTRSQVALVFHPSS